MCSFVLFTKSLHFWLLILVTEIRKVILLEEIPKRAWLPVDPQTEPELSCPWNVWKHLHLDLFQGHSHEIICVLEITWIVYVTEPSQVLSVNVWNACRWVQRSTHLTAPQDKSWLLIMHLPIEWCALSSVFPCLLCRGASFRFHWRNSWVCKPKIS